MTVNFLFVVTSYEKKNRCLFNIALITYNIETRLQNVILPLCLDTTKIHNNAFYNTFPLVTLLIFTHVQYCQSDTGRESYSRPDKLLRTVNILYDPSLFVSAVGSRVKRLLN